MRVVNVAPRDVWLTIEFPLEQIKFLKLIFDHANIEFDGAEEPEVKQATIFLNEHFYPFLKEVVENEDKLL